MATDLGTGERRVTVALVVLLLWLGVVPGTRLEPAVAYRSAVGDIPAH